VACHHLQRQGLRLIERNYRCRFGEIDLVMCDGGTVVFIEVRYRRSRQFGHPAETVDARKRERLCRAGSHFIQHRARLRESPCRFDVVTVEPNARGHRVSWFPHAFEG
jgi:putative endonuclease